jgi:hypothetical protein
MFIPNSQESVIEEMESTGFEVAMLHKVCIGKCFGFGFGFGYGFSFEFGFGFGFGFGLLNAHG